MAGLQPSTSGSRDRWWRPQRITATVPWGVLKRLQERADHEGRSLSSLVSHLLEVAIS